MTYSDVPNALECVSLVLSDKNRRPNLKTPDAVIRSMLEILDGLEQSLFESKLLETQMVMNGSEHSHFQAKDFKLNDHFANGRTTNKSSDQYDTTTMSRSRINLPDACSTISIVRLQYQYDELVLTYKDLLETLHEKSKELHDKDDLISSLYKQIEGLELKLTAMNETVIKLCSKFIEMKKRKERQISDLRQAENQILNALQQSRQELQDIATGQLISERDTKRALLLSEIKRSNRLYQENLLLKRQLEKLSPGAVDWSKSEGSISES